MGLYIPSVEQLPLETDAQKANAERMLGLINTMDSEVLLPNWTYRIEAWNNFFETYDATPRDMGTATRAIVGAICAIEKIEDTQQRKKLLDTVEESNFGHLLNVVTDQFFNKSDVDFFLLTAAREDGFDRAIYKVGGRAIANELTMLGTEFKVAEINQTFQTATEYDTLIADTFFYVGAENHSMIFTQMNVDNAYNNLSILSDAYAALKRRHTRPVEPERLIGVVHNVVRNTDFKSV